MKYVYVILLSLALVVIELLIGGTRLVFSLPSYTLLAVLGVLTVVSIRSKIIPASLSCLVASTIFFGYILIRTVLSPSEYQARSDLLMVLGALVVYLSFALILPTARIRYWFVTTILALALLNVCLGAIQCLRREPLTLFPFIQPGDYGVRAMGLYICPNHMAGFLEVAVLFGLGLACWGRVRPWVRVLAGYVVLMGVVGIILSGSRGGYLSLGVGIAVFVALSLAAVRRVATHRFMMVAVCVVGILAFVSVAAGIILTSQTTLRTRAMRMMDETSIRPHLWGIAMAQFKLQPLTGTGSRTFQYYGRHFRAPQLWTDPEYTHNDYLQLLAEFGVVGAATFLVFLGAHLWNGWRAFRWLIRESRAATGKVQSDSLALLISALSCVAAYMVHSLVDFNLHIPANTLVMAFAFGILANAGLSTPIPGRSFPQISRWFRLALPLLAVWIFWKGSRTLPAEFYAERARVAVRDQKYPEGQSFAELGLHWDRSNPLLHSYLGESHYSIGEGLSPGAERDQAMQLATEAYRRAVALDGYDRWLLLGLGWALDDSRKWDEAEPFFARVAAAEPNSFQIGAYYALHFHAAGKLARAKEEYERSMALHWNPVANAGLERLKREAAQKPPAPAE